MKKPLKRFKVTVVRTERDVAWFEVEAENEARAKAKAAYKADNGFIATWKDIDLELGERVDVCEIEEVAS